MVQTRTIIAFLLALFAGPVLAVNMMSFIESARSTPIVYIGTVGHVEETGRNDFFVQMHADIDVKVIGRGGGDAPPQVASFPYPSYDAKTGPAAGGPEYVLRPGMWVLVFSRHQFDDTEQPNYLRSGTRNEVMKLIQDFGTRAVAMDDEDLKSNMISPAQRDEQVALYRELLEKLNAVP
jgi:hypothetical protein